MNLESLNLDSCKIGDEGLANFSGILWDYGDIVYIWLVFLLSIFFKLGWKWIDSASFLTLAY
jgi:hypothetical protein